MCIEVFIPDSNTSIDIFDGQVEHCCRLLTKREIEQVVSILLCDKKAMQKQRNFPLVYDEMLSDLIEVQRERYDLRTKKEKRRDFGYTLSISKMEEILAQYYKFKDVHIDSIHFEYTGREKEDE